jgi:hypothetical protein
MDPLEKLAAGREQTKAIKTKKVTIALSPDEREKLERFAKAKNFSLQEACGLFFTVGVEAYEAKHGTL